MLLGKNGRNIRWNWISLILDLNPVDRSESNVHYDQQLVTLNDSAGTLVGGLVELSKLKKGREAKSILDVAHNVSHAVIK